MAMADPPIHLAFVFKRQRKMPPKTIVYKVIKLGDFMTIFEPGISETIPSITVSLSNTNPSAFKNISVNHEHVRENKPNGTTIKLTVGIAIKLPKKPDKLSRLNVAIDTGNVANDAMVVEISDAMT